MASLTIVSGAGYNSHGNSHIVGYESGRYRYEYFNFTVPETVPDTGAPIISARITSGSINTTGQYLKETTGNSGSQAIYFKIVGQDKNHELGYVSFTGDWSYPNLVVTDTNCSLTPGTTYQICFFIKNSVYYWRYFPNYASGMTISLGIEYESYTNCTAPTTISISPSIQKRGGTATISWSGATAGISNSIKKYQIQYKVGSGNWTSLADTTSSSQTFTVPTSGAYGSYIQARVKTIGNASGYDSDWADSSTTACRINTPPGAPTVELSNKIIASATGSTVKVTKAVAGSDVDNQSTTLEYSSGATGTKTTFKVGTTFSSAGTYYFYTKDSLGEYSSATTITIQKNSPPSITISNPSGTSATNYTDKDSTSNSYIYNPTFTFAVSGGQSDNNSYTCQLYCGSSTTNLSFKRNLDIKDAKVSIKDIRGEIGVGQYYRIKMTRNDGIETCTGQSGIFYIPAPKGIEAISNKLQSYTSISGFENYFSLNIQPYFYKDTGYDQVIIYINNIPYDTVNLYQTSSVGAGLSFAQVSNISEASFSRGATKAFSFAFYNSKTLYSYKIQGSKNFTRIKFNNLSNLIWNGTTNPYTQTGDRISFLNIFHKGGNIPDSDLKAYGFSSEPEYQIKASYGTETSTLSPTFLASYDDPSTAFISLSRENIYNLYKDFSMNKNSNESYSTSFYITVSNVFGDVYQTFITKKISWGTSPTIELKDFTVGNLEEPSFLKEGMQIKGTLTIKSYHKTLSKIIIEGKQGSNIFYQAEITPPEISGPTSNSPVSITYKLDNANLIIREQLKDLIAANEVIFTITGTNSLNNSSSITKTLTNCKVYSHIPGVVNISTGNYISIQGSEEINYNFNFLDFGMGDALQNYSKITEIKIIAFDNEEKVIKESNISEVNFNKESQNKSLPLNLGETQFIKIQIKATITSYTNSLRTENPLPKNFYSNKYVVYNSTPTISYRKNQLGINYDLSKISDLNIDEEDTIGLIVGEHSGKNNILFKSANSYSLIDISTGRLSGFHLDGGSW